MKRVLLPLIALGFCAGVLAKLPPLSPEAKAKADQAAARNTWQAKVDAYKLCLAQDRVAAHYRKTTPAAKPSAAPAAACPDPGPFAYTPPAAKPIEAAGAHSPPGTASSPPSTLAPAAAASAPKS